MGYQFLVIFLVHQHVTNSSPTKISIQVLELTLPVDCSLDSQGPLSPAVLHVVIDKHRTQNWTQAIKL